MLMVARALKGEELPYNLNEIFFTLISKVDHPQMVTQLHPIGLCNVAYKVITKCLVNRLKNSSSKAHLSHSEQFCAWKTNF